MEQKLILTDMTMHGTIFHSISWEEVSGRAGPSLFTIAGCAWLAERIVERYNCYEALLAGCGGPKARDGVLAELVRLRDENAYLRRLNTVMARGIAGERPPNDSGAIAPVVEAPSDVLAMLDLG